MAARKTKPTTKKKPAPTKKPTPKKKPPPRGPALHEAILANLARKIGEPQPLTPAELRAAEDTCGVALSPAMYATLAFDAGWLTREYALLTANPRRLAARPTFEVIAEHAGVFAEAYEDLCARRFPGKAIALDQGSDSMRLLYLGDPDELGEYPVLFIDHDDTPMLGVEHAGFDIWLAIQLGVLPGSAFERELPKTRRRLLGTTSDWEMFNGLDALPAPVPGPLPGSVVRAPPAPQAAARGAAPPAKPKKLTDKQLEKALVERAAEPERLGALIADARERRLPRATFDAPLIKAAQADCPRALKLLLDAGASPKARDYYGCVLSRAITYGAGAEVIRTLLAAGANPNGPSVNGKTPLFEAIEKNAVELTRILLEAGADPDHKESNGRTPVHEAASRSVDNASPDLALLDLVLAHGGSPDGGKSHSRPLHAAVETRLPDQAMRLIDRGADVNGRSDYLARTPLHIAFETGNDALAAALIARGADRSLEDERGIRLDAFYGPRGEDVRPLEVRYVPDEATQELTVSVRIAVLNHHHLAHSFLPHLGAKHWADLIASGVAAGARFAPWKSRARVIASDELGAVSRPGFHDLTMKLEVAAVAPELLRLVARKVLGAAFAFTGAGVMAAVRPVALAITGSRAGAGAVDGATLRAWIDDDRVQLGAYPGELPFALRVVEGAPRLSIAFARDLEGAEGDVVAAHANAWFALSDLWPRAGAAPPTPRVLMPANFGAQPPRERVFDVRDLAPAKGKGEAFPFAREPALAALKNAVRALHHRVPVAEVVLGLPPL
jgi:ankyrin repeat protein